MAFGFEPNFRAFTDGTQTLLRNAILGADPAPAALARIAAVRSPARAKARRAARRLTSARGAVRLVVRRADARAARAVVRRQHRRVRVVRGGGRVTFLIGGGRDLSGDEHRWGRSLERALRRADVRVVMYRVPTGARRPLVDEDELRVALGLAHGLERRVLVRLVPGPGGRDVAELHDHAALVGPRPLEHLHLAAARQEAAAVVGDRIRVAAAVLGEHLGVADVPGVGDDVGRHAAQHACHAVQSFCRFSICPRISPPGDVDEWTLT